VGRSRVKGSLKRAVYDHPGEILTDSGEMRQRRGRWAESFGEAAPLHLEVGMGRGRFLAELAARDEPVSYVGVEIKPDRCVTALEKIRRRARRPFVVLNAAVEILPQLFLPGEVQRIYLNFPDPWPAYMYRGRRLFNTAFLRLYQGLLPVGGELWFRSDQAACYEELLASLPPRLRVEEHGCDYHAGGHEFTIFQTEYERRYRAAGATIHHARLVKTGSGILEIRAGC